MSDQDLQDLVDLCEWLDTSEPRKLSPRLSGVNILFTDGACEYVQNKRLVTCGALLFPADGSRPLMFGFEIPQDVSETWASSSDKEQLVTEAELFPNLVALKCWKDHFAFRRSLFFVDSEPAKHCFIRGTSEVEACALLVKEFYNLVDQLKLFPWFSRVPSASNPADSPSRLNFEENARLFDASHICVNSYL